MYAYNDQGFIYFICSLILLSIALICFYKKNDQLGSALSAAAFGMPFTLIIVKWIDDLPMLSEYLTLVFFAVIIFTWFALITFLLIKFIPNGHFNNLPLAVGAWLSGFVLSVSILTIWGNFSLIMGIVFVALAAYLLKINQNLFIR